MDWMLLFVMAACMLFIHLNKGRIRPKELLKELLSMVAFVVVYSLLKSYFSEKLSIKSPVAKIPSDIKMRLGGGVFFLITCAFSYVGWKRLKQEKEEIVEK
ncbi:hypothetical protein [Bacillus sp. B-jedd]|uniref:hypothetical protein n=1 Tax=Bacillus sp. B-jedd TaxID=1476857 RepID=UPI0005155BEB|nr:hypothetical protein [Bacillus sp. B-jedd]CEG28840.1 hypothetical protein BN1002_03764 [Bacillus sp. B-jedd]